MIGYARTSTHDQRIDLQISALRAVGCDRIFEDSGFSGAHNSRLGLEQALNDLCEGDQLITWKLDRLSRSLQDLLHIVGAIQLKGSDFRSLTENIDTSSPGGKLIFHVMGALAEFERALIVERTKAGIEAAKIKGQKFGRRRKLTAQQISLAKELLRDQTRSTSDVARLFNVHRSTLWRAVQSSDPALRH